MKYIACFLTLALSSLAVYGEDHPFNGLIVDGFGNPVKNARVWVSDEACYATSDKLGRFGLSDINPTDTLSLRIKKELYRIAVDGRKSIKITVIDTGVREVSEEPEIMELGYGYVKRRERINASSGITGARLRATGASDILTALRGLVPGLNIGGSPRNNDRSVTIRGIHSINSSNEPLYIVDDLPVSTLDGINLYDVERVEVLKDAPIYGSRGANGAIIVITKRGRP
ncbi:hypothetical protein E4T81_13515 [Barnesiella sp. WM24]|uniref:TonB-dependent receptor plug domain-containing protein n=1 Tax=Barnesiella sp. WM24 TaxID=2558278 RepID=UPI001072D367|nr:TonB-dependent receptor plug domain-containing protein [Barnesiella sp. WM24]TFU91957.1 hypothetical protein E4T81_13515 [Barnesiella sp. WM24]